MSDARKPHLMVWYMPDDEAEASMPEAERAAIEEAMECGVTEAAEWVESHQGGDEDWHAWGTREMGIATTAAGAAVAKYRKMREGKPDADTPTRPPS